ncbi:hypothetical protein ABPG72_009726 [Tetrahymena utriculariae]
MKKGTILGVFLLILVILTSLIYFVYILRQYVTNQIEPTFRSQRFITDHTLNIPLSSDLISFKLYQGNNYQLEKYKKKTYIIYVAFFYYQSNDCQSLCFLESQQQQLDTNQQQETEEKGKYQDVEKVDDAHENGFQPIFVPFFKNKQKQSLDIEQSSNMIQKNNHKFKKLEKPAFQEQKEILTENVNTERPLHKNKNDEKQDNIFILPPDSDKEKLNLQEGQIPVSFIIQNLEIIVKVRQKTKSHR